MPRTPVRVTPAVPCCDECVVTAFANAQFNVTTPFSIISGVAKLSRQARRAFVENLLANAEGEVVIVVSSEPPDEADLAAIVAGEDDITTPTLDELRAAISNLDEVPQA